MHKEVLTGRFVLQIDEIVNMAAAARERYSEQAGNRCLKFALTDGCQQVVGIEHAHLPAFTWDCPAGSKIVIHNVPIRRGLLLLGPDNTALLGGQVERLEAARQRAVAAWTKPVVGRPAGSAERDIFAEAREAAWAPGGPAGAQLHAGPGGAAPGAAGPQGQPAGGPTHAPTGHAPLGNGSGAYGAPGPEAPPRPGPQQQQALQQQQQQMDPAQLTVQPSAVGNGVHGHAAASAGAARTTTLGSAWQPAMDNAPSRPLNHRQQQQQQQQGWQPPPQQQQKAAAPQQGQAPLTSAAAPAGPWLGRPANASLRAGEGDDVEGHGDRVMSGPAGRREAPAQAVEYHGSAVSARGPGISGDSVGGGGSRSAGGNEAGQRGEVRGSSACPLELGTSSDSASGNSPSRSAMEQSGAGVAPAGHPQPQQIALQQQQQHETAGRRPSTFVAKNSLLGGSGAALPPHSGTAAAPSLGSSAPYPGLLPPRIVTAPRPSAPSPAVAPSAGAGLGTSAAAGGAVQPTATTGLRKPALPLARSSPGPGISLGTAGRSRSAATEPIPAMSTAQSAGLPHRAQQGPEPRPQGRGGGVGDGAGAAAGAGARRDLRAGLAAEVDMVDLASLDDDSDDEGTAHDAAAEPPCAAWQRGQNGKVRLPPSLDPAGSTDKRPRLSSDSLSSGDGNAVGSGGGAAAVGLASGHEAGHRRDDGWEAAAGASAGAGSRQGGRAGGTAQDGVGGTTGDALLAPATQMDMDSGSAVARALPAADTAGGAAGQHHPTAAPRLPQGVDAGRDAAMAAAVDHRSEDPMVVETRPNTACPGSRGYQVPGPAPDVMDAAAATGNNGLAQPCQVVARSEGAAEPANHAGFVPLCQVADLLRPDPNSDTNVVFPVTLDVYGLFHRLDGDTASIEDGTHMMDAQLADSALAPLLADAVPPDGWAADGPLGVEAIQAMAYSPDPVVQEYGQSLATRLMEFIRDFSGLIRLEFREPLPTQPLITLLINDGEDGIAGQLQDGASRSGGNGGGGCELYQSFLQDLGALGTGN